MRFADLAHNISPGRLAMDVGRFGALEELIDRCRCGVEPAAHHFGCLECGGACCSVCAITLESVAYCRHCAAALLGRDVEKPGSFEIL
jgi:hypothetical protein